jgi:hypothetical protein
MKRATVLKIAKVVLLTVATFGLYGAYWAMNQSFEEEPANGDETKKDAETVERAATSALLMRHDLH